jgi:hypothetical protein
LLGFFWMFCKHLFKEFILSREGLKWNNALLIEFSGFLRRTRGKKWIIFASWDVEKQKFEELLRSQPAFHVIESNWLIPSKVLHFKSTLWHKFSTFSPSTGLKEFPSKQNLRMHVINSSSETSDCACEKLKHLLSSPTETCKAQTSPFGIFMEFLRQKVSFCSTSHYTNVPQGRKEGEGEKVF